MTFNSNLTEDELYSLPSPIECVKLNMIAFYLVFVMITGVISNGFLLWVFYKHKDLRISLNMFLMAITALNLFGCITELPWVIGSNFACKWIFKKFGCVLSAYIMYMCGCASIYLMATISFERFYIIYKPLSVRKITNKLTVYIIIFCLLVGVFWATTPLLGWSNYALEGGLTSCSVDWTSRNTSQKTYIFAIFLFVFIIPLTVIVLANIKMLMIVKQMPNMSKNNELDEKAKKRIENERKLTIIMIAYIAIFIAAWTPYALVSLYSAFVDPDAISPIGATVPAVIAKSSLIWNTLFFIFSNRNIKSKVQKELNISVENTSSMNTKAVETKPKESNNESKKPTDVSDSNI